MKANIEKNTPSLPKGEYLFGIVEAKDVESKKSPGEYNVKATFAVTEGEHENKKHVQTISPKMKGLFRSFCIAVGFIEKDFLGAIEFDQSHLDTLVGMPVRGIGRVAEDQNGELRFEITRFVRVEEPKKAADAAAAATSGAAPAAPATEPAKPAAPAKPITRKTI